MSEKVMNAKNITSAYPHQITETARKRDTGEQSKELLINQPKFIIELDKEESLYNTISMKNFAISRVRQEIARHEEEVSDEFHIYYVVADSDTDDFVHQFLTDMYCKNKLEFIGTIFDNEPLVNSGHMYRYVKGRNINEYILRNKIYRANEYNIYIATINEYRSNGYVYQDIYIFCNSETQFKIFIEEVKEFRRELDEKHYRLLTDTSQGTSFEYIAKDYSVTEKDVLIAEELKKELYGMMTAFFETSFFVDNNIPYKRGILLYGPPGNGKTTFIKSIINRFKVDILIWQINEYSSSESIKQIFSTIKEDDKPYILIIEDIDSLPDRCRSQFLNALDGAYNNSGVFIIGTTNYPEKIDSALMNRAGRFDKAYKFNKPSNDIVREYLNKKGVNRFLTEDKIDYLISIVRDFSIAMLNEVYVQIAYSYHFNDGVINIDKIINDITEISKKQKKGDFDSEERKFGFTP